MDVISDRFIDIGLNALGYLIAGGLGMFLHTVIQERRQRSIVARKAMTIAEGPELKPAVTGNSDKGVEFVSLRTKTPVETIVATGTATLPDATSPNNSPYRNRREIIRMAREMLDAGTAGKKIRDTLPISQSELALLKNVSRN
ncbi:MAG: hypothetical protein J7J98_05300 [candidate division Zixibacteria bacterium]|nr:hypothetical protein [candidate division Zixibacteria bacterium]